MAKLSQVLALSALAACGNNDYDNDGYLNDDDCGPKDESVYPGALERCDAEDNDCNGKVDDIGVMTRERADALLALDDSQDIIPLYADKDGDGDFGKEAVGFVCRSDRSIDEDYSRYGGNDCDGMDPTMFGNYREPVEGQAKVFDSPKNLDGKDNDCDGHVDGGITEAAPAAISSRWPSSLPNGNWEGVLSEHITESGRVSISSLLNPNSLDHIDGLTSLEKDQVIEAIREIGRDDDLYNIAYGWASTQILNHVSGGDLASNIEDMACIEVYLQTPDLVKIEGDYLKASKQTLWNEAGCDFDKPTPELLMQHAEEIGLERRSHKEDDKAYGQWLMWRNQAACDNLRRNAEEEWSGWSSDDYRTSFPGSIKAQFEEQKLYYCNHNASGVYGTREMAVKVFRAFHVYDLVTQDRALETVQRLKYDARLKLAEDRLEK